MRKKAIPSPSVATTTPASEGPRIRARLNREEFKAMAFPRSSGPTISTTKACRAGTSSIWRAASPIANPHTCQAWMWPLQVSQASRKACSIIRDWVATISQRRGKRSARLPPNSARGTKGRAERPFITPRPTGEPVRR